MKVIPVQNPRRDLEGPILGVQPERTSPVVSLAAAVQMRVNNYKPVRFDSCYRHHD